MGRRGFYVLVVSLLLATIAACGSRSNAAFCDETTACVAAETVCDLGVNACVRDPAFAACDDGDPSDCPNGEAFCTGGQCAGCTSAAACGDATPICEVEIGTCRACEDGPDCAVFDGRPVCALDGACVTCTPEAGCDGATPVCDAGACRACTADAECDVLCDEDTGHCAQPDEVLFLDAAASPGSTTCSREAPCSALASVPGALTSSTRWVVATPGLYLGDLPTLDLDAPLTLEGNGATFVGAGPLTLGRGRLRVRDAGIDGGIVCGDAADHAEVTLERVRLDADESCLVAVNCTALVGGSQLTSRASAPTDGAALRVEAASTVTVAAGRIVGGGLGILSSGTTSLFVTTVEDAVSTGVHAYLGTMAIRGGAITGSGGRGIELGSVGSLPGAPTLLVDSVVVAGSAQAGLGLYKGAYEISNSFIIENGNGLGPGGAVIMVASGSFAFNTVAGNRSRIDGCGRGDAQCDVYPSVSCGNAQALTSSYVATAGTSRLGEAPTSGCLAVNSGTSLCVPDFVDDDPETVAWDYHLGPATTCRASAEGTSPATDYDGQPRPQGAGSEIGADEIE